MILFTTHSFQVSRHPPQEYLFYKKDESEILLSFAQYRILFNNSEELHTIMSIKTHLHIKAARLFSTQEIYNKGLNARYMYG